MQRLHRGGRIAAVDERGIHRLADRAHDRVLRQFLLAHRSPVVAHQRANDDGVDLIAVIEDEDRRALSGQVFFANDVELHPCGRQYHLRERGGEEVDAAPATAGQHADAHGAGHDRKNRAEAHQRSDLPLDAHRIAAVEPQDRPASALGDGSHLPRGIGRPRVADQVHQGDVLVAVGIEVTVLEIDVVLVGESLHRGGLAGAPKDRLRHPAGQQPVDGRLELVGEGVGDSEEPRHRVDLDGQRRRAQHDGVASGDVGAHQLAHLRVDAGLDPLDEQLLADLLKVGDQSSRQRTGSLADQVLELAAPQRVAQARLDHAEQLTDAHVATQDALLGEDDGREARHQRPVQVEKRADARPGRAVHDLRD